MRAEAKLGVGVSAAVVILIGGYYMFRGEREKPIPVSDGPVAAADASKKDANQAKPAANNANNPKQKPAQPNDARRTGNQTAANRPGNQPGANPTSPNAPAGGASPNQPAGTSLTAKSNPNAATNPPPVQPNVGGDRTAGVPNAAGNPPATASRPALIPTNPNATADASTAPGLNQPPGATPSRAGEPQTTLTADRATTPTSTNPGAASTVVPASIMNTGTATNQPTSGAPNNPANSPPAASHDSSAANRTGNTPSAPTTANGAVRSTDPKGGAVESHRVQAGDTFASLAESYYGNRRYSKFLIDSNPEIKDAKKLNPGMVVKIPPKPSDDTLVSAVPGSKERDPESKPASTTDDKTTTASGEKSKTYKVKSGDSFYSIAKNQLGSANKWKKLYELNKQLVDGDPTNLKPGQVLKLPEA